MKQDTPHISEERHHQFKMFPLAGSAREKIDTKRDACFSREA